MGNRVMLGGREVTNPLAKVIVGIVGVAFGLTVAAMVLVLVLPMIGVALSVSLGTVGIVLLLLLLGLPVFLFGGALFALILAPFAILKKLLERR